MTRGTPQQALASQFYRKITGLLIELYQLEEEQVAGKRYLTMGFVSVDRRMLSRVAAACQKIAPLKRSAAQYKETLQRLDEVFEYIESHYQDVLTMEETAKHVGFSPITLPAF